jgi:Tfp pilus assembly protein PilV
MNFFSKVNDKGHGLVEALIATVMIAGGAIALARFQNNLSFHDTATLQQGQATILATKQLETLRDFQVINNQSPFTSYQSISSGTSTYAGNTATYTITWTVTSYTNPTYKNLDVTVAWTDRNNTGRSVRLISNIAGIEPAYSASIM